MAFDGSDVDSSSARNETQTEARNRKGEWGEPSFGMHQTPKKKRNRVSQACNICRRRKERCNGAHPRCDTCSRLGRTCNYNGPPKKRGLPSGYVRITEVLLGLIFHITDDSEDMVTALLQGKQKIRRPSDSALSMAGFMANRWKTSRPSKELEELFAVVESGDGDGSTSRDFYERLERLLESVIVPNQQQGLLGDDPIEFIDVSSLISPPTTAATHNSTIPGPEVMQTSQSDVEHHNAIDETALQTASDVVMALPCEWSYLLDLYFTTAHSWAPLLQKHDVFRHAYSVSNAMDEGDWQGTAITNGERAALYAVLAFAAFQDKLISAKMGTMSKAGSDLTGRCQRESNRALALSSEQTDHEPYQLQALLVLTALHLEQGNLSRAWLTVGRAVYMAVDSEILPNRSDIGLPNEMNRRLCCNVFVFETIIALRLSRRPYLQRSDICEFGTIPTDSIEEWEPVSAGPSFSPSTTRQAKQPGRLLSTFNCYFRLACLLNDLLHHTSSVGESWESFTAWTENLSAAQRSVVLLSDDQAEDLPPHLLNLALLSICVQVVLYSRACDGMEGVLSQPLLQGVSRSLNIVATNMEKHPTGCPFLSLALQTIEIHICHPTFPGSTTETQDLQSLVHRIKVSADHKYLLETAGHFVSNEFLSSDIAASDRVSNIINETPAAPNNNLFDSLAVLDTMEGSQDPEQFFQNLGTTSSIGLLDFETSFDL